MLDAVTHQMGGESGKAATLWSVAASSVALGERRTMPVQPQRAVDRPGIG